MLSESFEIELQENGDTVISVYVHSHAESAFIHVITSGVPVL